MVAGLVATLLLVGGLLLAVTLPGLFHNLQNSRGALKAAQTSLAVGDIEAAKRHISEAGTQSRAARQTVDGVRWTIFSHVPVLRTSVREVRQITRALDAVNRTVLPPLLQAAQRPSGWTGRIDPAPFLAARAPVTAAEVTLLEVRRQLIAVPSAGVSQVTDARTELASSLASLARSVTELRVAANAVPALVSGRRQYLLVVQNNAEQRATGGLFGAYGVLGVDHGKLALNGFGPNQDLKDPERPVIDVGAEYDQRYGRFQTTRTWRSANLSPDTPTVGRLLTALWEDRRRGHLDGVVLIDPVGLAHLLSATGPIKLADGTTLTAKNAVDLMLIKAYERFSTKEDAARNAYLEAAARRTFARIIAGGINYRRLASALGRAIGTGHLQVVSSQPSVERQLRDARVGGALAFKGPFLEVVTQDVGGSKLGVYQQRRVRYAGKLTGRAVDLGAGPVSEEEAFVSVVLQNRAPAALPDYVVARPDNPSAPRGQSKTWLSVYLAARSTLLSATLDGRPVALESGTEQGLSVFSTFVVLDRGASATLVLRVRQPASPGEALTYRQQPLITPDRLSVSRNGPWNSYYDR